MRKIKPYNPQRALEINLAGKAQSLARKALKFGILNSEICKDCGDTKTQAHHSDYRLPLKIIWLCQIHHDEWHRKNKPIYNDDPDIIKTWNDFINNNKKRTGKPVGASRLHS